MKYYIPKGYRRLRMGERFPNIDMKYWRSISQNNLKGDGQWVDLPKSALRVSGRWNFDYCIHIRPK